jgi:hypothetical protein
MSRSIFCIRSFLQAHLPSDSDYGGGMGFEAGAPPPGTDPLAALGVLVAPPVGVLVAPPAKVHEKDANGNNIYLKKKQIKGQVKGEFDYDEVRHPSEELRKTDLKAYNSQMKAWTRLHRIENGLAAAATKKKFTMEQTIAILEALAFCAEWYSAKEKPEKDTEDRANYVIAFGPLSSAKALSVREVSAALLHVRPIIFM